MDFLSLQKNLLLYGWRVERKNTKKLNLFQGLNMLKKLFQLKFRGCFSTHIKTRRFVVPLIVLGKWRVFDGQEIHPKNILRRNKESGQGAINRARKLLR